MYRLNNFVHADVRAVQSPESLGLKGFPLGYAAGFDYDLAGTSGDSSNPKSAAVDRATVLCSLDGASYDYMTRVTLTTDVQQAKRLVGISFNCSKGSYWFAYSGDLQLVLKHEEICHKRHPRLGKCCSSLSYWSHRSCWSCILQRT